MRFRFLIGTVFSLLVGTLHAVPAQATTVHVVELDNQIISPVTQTYLLEAIQHAEEAHAECLILLLDTPGGLLDSTRTIVKRMMNARVPIVVYVAPSGARAGSAGVFLTLASHIAAMAPSTNIGAAHPVMPGDGGGPIKKLIRRVTKDHHHGNATPAPHEEIVEEESRDPMTEKITNDTVAWVTTIARTRHRNEAWAARAVTESVSVTEQEAVKEGIVDLVAKDLPELLAKLDGWPVELGEASRTLSTAHATVTRIPLSRRQQFLATITNPNIAYLLMLFGTLGLIFEFTHPGIAFPGIAGVICLILALYAFQALPTNYAALGLMGFGLLCLLAEIKLPGFGLLALGGVVALTLGSLLLFDASEGVGVSWRLIVPVVAGTSAIILFLVNLVVRAQRQPAKTGAAALIGLHGIAETDVSPTGHVFIRGELWRAHSAEPIQKGQAVRVIGAEGLTLRVSPSR